MSDLDPKPTRNLRHPVLESIPRNGRMIRLTDGRRGWLAGHAQTPGKLTFVDPVNHSAVDLWPTELVGYVEL